MTTVNLLHPKWVDHGLELSVKKVRETEDPFRRGKRWILMQRTIEWLQENLTRWVR